MFNQNPLITKSEETTITGWTGSTLYSLFLSMTKVVSVRALLLCKIAANGYAVGDYVELNAQNGVGGAGAFGFAPALTGGFLKIRTASSGLLIRDFSTGASASVTSTNYDLVLRVYGK